MSSDQSNELPIFTVDAFTKEAFGGNAAGVCICNNGFPSRSTMQLIGREMNLSETAFVVPTGTSNKFLLKWFTPAAEIPLCGHATLASGHVLFSYQGMEGIPKLTSDTVEFETLSGILSVTKNQSSLFMDFPQGKPIKVTLNDSTLNELVKGLSLSSVSDIKEAWYCTFTNNIVLDLGSTELVDKVKPIESALLAVNFGEYNANLRGVSVTAASRNSSNPKYQKHDFVSRYFAPWLGVLEDPVTGSIHTVLGVIWNNKLNGKSPLLAYQASLRGGEMTLTLAKNNRILMAGDSVTIMKGSIRSK